MILLPNAGLVFPVGIVTLASMGVITDNIAILSLPVAECLYSFESPVILYCTQLLSPVWLNVTLFELPVITA